MADAEETNEEHSRASHGMTVVDFYGNRVSSIKNSPFYERVKARETDYRVRPIAVHPRQKITGVSTQWSIFEKQAPALELCARSNYELRVFSSEMATDGRRSFVVSHPEVFWKIYVQRNPLDRHSYEVIPEYLPCKLYFDLEFYREFNPGRDGETMVGTIVRLAVHLFKDQFGLEVDPKLVVVDLTASTEKKFSRHLIFDVPVAAFENSYEVGKFVQLMQSLIDQRAEIKGVATAEELEELEVTKDQDGRKTSFIDTGVYTKNRNFRLFLSSKIGQRNPLMATGRWKRFPSEKALFFASLVTVSYQDNITLLSFSNSECSEKEKTEGTPSVKVQSVKASAQTCKGLDAFVEQLVNPGRIRRKFETKPGEKIVFDIDSGYRFCCNIQREHKSNHIRIVIDVPLKGFYQACYDPDCKNYESPLQPLPSEVVRELESSRAQDKLDWGDIPDEDLLMICDGEPREAGDSSKKEDEQFGDLDESSEREISLICDELEKSDAEMKEEETWDSGGFSEREVLEACNAVEKDNCCVGSDQWGVREFSSQEISMVCDACEKQESEGKKEDEWGEDLDKDSEDEISMICDAVESVAGADGDCC